mgnify:FL=1
MNNKKNELVFMFGLGCLMFSIVVISYSLIVSFDNKQLYKKLSKMNQEIINYEWQLSQVKWICEVAHGE